MGNIACPHLAVRVYDCSGYCSETKKKGVRFDDDTYDYVWTTESTGPDSLEGIVSPDLSKMYRIVRGNTQYFYHSKDRYERALEKFSKQDLNKQHEEL